MTTTNAERMAKSRAKKKANGLESVQVWVPCGDAFYIKRLAQVLREQKQPTDKE